ncbi:hypothetical protein WME73_14905 [Sorangium sp. So ce302]|uniref:tetratricopeptide repeat protein n=1 Tax=Sorangium sp. So ce302 TaxID=3133297 RepID=UPI003F618CCA
MERSPDWLSLCTDAIDLAAQDAEALETHLLKSPNDVEVRVKLLGFYFRNQDDDTRRRRIDHVRWLIAHHPEICLAAFARIAPHECPDAYNEGKRLWLSAVSNHPNDPAILRNAGRFLSIEDRDLAEELYRRGTTVEPDTSDWRELLGGLCFLSSIGATSREERVRLAREALAEYEAALTLERSALGAFGILIDIARVAVLSENYERAAEAAERLLSDATDHVDTFEYGNAMHYAHVVLGKVAMARSDSTSAVEHLQAAGEVRGSPQLNTFGPDFELASQLFSIGHRGAVLSYIDGCKRFWESGASVLEKWVLAIERGETPDFSERWAT